jgi:hypothetical protein
MWGISTCIVLDTAKTRHGHRYGPRQQTEQLYSIQYDKMHRIFLIILRIFVFEAGVAKLNQPEQRPANNFLSVISHYCCQRYCCEVANSYLFCRLRPHIRRRCTKRLRAQPLIWSTVVLCLTEHDPHPHFMYR